MKYQALYRKYRPKTLDEVVGQDIVIKTLKNSLSMNKISHAYMFSGPRGTGKTSIAKIMAKTVNCLDIKDAQICGICNNCISCDNNSPDIIEIDAASNNGVDEIREIRNKVNLVPAELKYKVYIIDEVHMLTTGAFNALLKTLEEPPEHAIFILATTDPHKVPITVVSRCQCFEFKRINEKNMFDRIKYICDSEQIKIEEDVINNIIKTSDGCMRDALGVLDKLSSYTNETITISDYYDVVNIVSRETVENFIEQINIKNINSVLDIVDEIFEHGNDIMIFTQNLMEILKDDLIKYYTDKTNKYEIVFTNDLIKLLNQIYIEFRESPNQKILFEVEILNFISNDINLKKENQSEKNISREIKASTTSVEKIKEEPIIENKTNKIVEKETINNDNNYQLNKPIYVNNTFATANKENKQKVMNCWSKLGDYKLNSNYSKPATFLLDASIRAVGDDYMIISYKYESGISDGIQMINKITNLLYEMSGLKYKIALLTEEEWNNEKKLYIDNTSNNIKYILKEEITNLDETIKKKKIKESKVLSKSTKKVDAKSLFGDSVIEI